ncbi:MAG: NfeD family protein [Candidatus Izemoplasmatales bacterium]|nr:NfeD family protein [Candidatus Izemoplasmatales bacterium]
MFLDVSVANTMLLLWFAVFILAAILEASTMALTSVWFAAGAFVSFIIALIWPNAIVAQVAAFLVVSAFLLFEIRPALKGYLQKNDIKTNSDKLVGKIAVCTTAFKAGDRGEVKIEGKIWTAISNEDIKLNDKVEVLAIDGVKLVVKKAE